MRTIQEIFDAVIDGGYYANEFTPEEVSGHMCVALTYANAADRITEAERHLALDEIQEYLQGAIFLSTVLSIRDLPYEHEDRLAIYRDWVNRPQLKGLKHAG